MRTTKAITLMGKSALLLSACLCAGFSPVARANLTLIDTYKATPEDTAHIVQVASGKLGAPDLTSLLRLEDLSLPPSGSPFTVSYPTNNTADVSWNVSGSGFDLLGIYIFGGSNGADLYKITDPSQMISGSGVIHPPVTGNSGQFADISHTLFLTVPVPEPSSVILVSLVGVGFTFWRRYQR